MSQNTTKRPHHLPHDPKARCRQLAGAGLPREQVLEALEREFPGNQQAMSEYLEALHDRARQRLTQPAELSVEQLCGWLRGVKADPGTSVSARLRAQGQLERLLGEEADPQEAWLFYDSVMLDPQATVHQQLSALQRLARLMNMGSRAARQSSSFECPPQKLAETESPAAQPQTQTPACSTSRAQRPRRPLAVPPRTPGGPLDSLPRPPRNAPCPCGSGLKYKYCCLSLRTSTPD